jgi:hypothetical protein
MKWNVQIPLERNLRPIGVILSQALPSDSRAGTVLTDSDAGSLADVRTGLRPMAKRSAGGRDSSLGLAPLTPLSLVLVIPVGEHMPVPPFP